MSQISKLTFVDPFAVTAQYIRGTEAGHFYKVVNDHPVALVGFRPLGVNVPAKDSKPVVGTATRVRFVPKDQSETGLAKVRCVIEKVIGLGFRKYNGESDVHFSLVTSDAPALIAKINTALSLF